MVEPQEPACLDVTPCGGEAIGDWETTSSCLEASGNFDLSRLGIGCSEGDIFGDLEVSGKLAFLETGVFLDETTTSADLALGLAPACLDIAGTPITCEALGPPLMSFGFASARCLDAPGGGCVCGVQVQQAGGLGHVRSDVTISGTYEASDETLTLSNLNTFTYDYCASVNTLVMTPTGTSPLATIRGTVAFERRALFGREVGARGDAGP